MIRVAIIADTRLYREGLAQSLGRAPRLRVVATAGRQHGALEQLSQLQADVILIDMVVPGGLAAVRTIVESAADARVIALGIADENDDVLACAEAGVSGYVSRDASLDDLVAAIESATRGEAICSPRVAAGLMRRVATLAADRPGGDPPPPLTGREREIVRLIDRGLANKEIARELGIEVATVKNHVHRILEKLRVRRRGEAAARMRGVAQPRATHPARRI